MAYVNGFAYKIVTPAADEEVPAALPARGGGLRSGSSGASSFATGTRRSSRPSIEAHRELQSVDPDALSDDDLAAHLTRCRDHHAEMIYQHMRFTAAAMRPDRRLPRARRRLDRPPAGRAARPDARHVARVGGRVRRARAADRRDPAGPTRASSCSTSDDDPRRVLDALRSLDGDTGRGRVRPISTSSATGCSTASTSRSPTRSSCRTRCSARSAPPSRGRASRRRTSTSADRRRARQGARASIGPQFDELLEEARLTYRIRDERGVFSDIWASGLMRRAALARRSPARRQGAGSTTPRTSSTPASTRCARCCPARTGPRPTSSRSAPHTARRTPPRTPRRRWAPRRRRRRTRPGCRPPPAA